MSLTDPTTGLDVLIKQPGEARLYHIPFSQELRTGETISGVNSITQTKMGVVAGADDLTIGVATLNDDADIMQTRISGGTDGEHYKLEAIVTTSQSDTIEVDVMLYLAD